MFASAMTTTWGAGRYGGVRAALAIAITLLLTVTCFAAPGEPRRVHRITIADGLSQSTVSAIIQDAQGFVWLGTGDGVDITDGVSFERLRHDPDKSDTLADNYIRTLLLSADGRVWVGTDGGGLNRYDPATGKVERFPIRPITDDAAAEIRAVYALHEDVDGTLWIGSANGMFRYEPNENTFSKLAGAGPVEWPQDTVRTIIRRQNGTLWFGTRSQGVYALPADGVLTHFGTDVAASVSGTMTNRLFEDSAQRLWVGTETKGLSLFDEASGLFARVANGTDPRRSLSDDEVTSIVEDHHRRLWLGTWSSGLVSFDPATSLVDSFKTSDVDRNTFSSNTVIDLMIDTSGTLWAGTYDNGANRLQIDAGPFLHYVHDPLQRTGPSGRMVWSFAQGSNGTVWVGTKTGLSLYNNATGTFTWRDDPAFYGRSGSRDVRALWQSDRTLWVGTFGGLNAVNLDTGVGRTYRNHASDDRSLPDDKVRLLLERDDGLWVGTQNGLARFDKRLSTFDRARVGDITTGALPHARIRALAADRGNRLWVGTSGGLSLRDDATGNYRTWTSTNSALPDDDVRAVIDLGAEGLWVGTQKGVARLDIEQGTFGPTLSVEEGLANATTYTMTAEPRAGESTLLWITTNNGLSRFDVGDGSFQNYAYRDGIQSNEFNFNAALRSKDGRIWLGGVDGITVVVPERLTGRSPPPQVYAALLDGSNNRKKGRMLRPGSDIKIAPSQDSLTLRLNALHYLIPEENRLRYRMVGIDDAWTENSGAGTIARYDNIGGAMLDRTLTLELVARSSDNSVSEISRFNFTVKAVWWRHPFVVFLAVLTIAALGLIAVRRFKNEQQLNANLLAQKQETDDTLEEQARKLAQLLSFRTDFFRRASHELRTPLTLMRGPVDAFSAANDKPPDRRLLAVLRRNLDRLQRLSDEMLFEDGESIAPPPARRIDLSTFLAPIFDSFIPKGAALGIDLKFGAYPANALHIHAEALEDILYILLSNALRHCGDGDSVKVDFEINAGHLTVYVRDTGPGIDEKLRSGLFTSGRTSSYAGLNRSSNGLGLDSGLGLAIAHDRANSVGGFIKLISSETGCHFKVVLPCTVIDCQAKPEFCEPHDFSKRALAKARNDGQNLPRLLLIEDEADMAELLTISLGTRWNISHKETAAKAQTALQSQDFDIVLSDVMLPDGSGLNIVGQIRENIETSHLPIVLLTALSDRKSETAGLKSQADDYVTKPFDLENLEQRLNNLLTNRQRQTMMCRRAWTGESDASVLDGNADTAVADLSARDQAFLEQLENILSVSLADPTFTIKALAEELNIGEQTLRRKLRALLGLSPKGYLNAKRMQKAKVLLRAGESVKTAAYATGYKDPSHFSRVFRTVTGQGPKQYRES